MTDTQHYKLFLIIPFLVNLGDKIEYSPKESIYDLVQRTLWLLEETGGYNAFVNIKYVIPTYESCIYNR